MNKALPLIIIAGIVFVLNYEAYYWDPCGGDTCFSVEGHHVAPKVIYCDSLGCVEDILEETGIEHLSSIFRIDYTENTATIKPVRIKYKATLK